MPEPALDPDTLRRFAAGDESAFSAVYRRYARPMFTVALQVMLGTLDVTLDLLAALVALVVLGFKNPFVVDGILQKVSHPENDGSHANLIQKVAANF